MSLLAKLLNALSNAFCTLKARFVFYSNMSSMPQYHCNQALKICNAHEVLKHDQVTVTNVTLPVIHCTSI